MRLEAFLNEQMLQNFYFDDEDDPEIGGQAKRLVIFTSRKTENNKTNFVSN